MGCKAGRCGCSWWQWSCDSVWGARRPEATNHMETNDRWDLSYHLFSVYFEFYSNFLRQTVDSDHTAALEQVASEKRTEGGQRDLWMFCFKRDRDRVVCRFSSPCEGWDSFRVSQDSENAGFEVHQRIRCPLSAILPVVIWLNISFRIESVVDLMAAFSVVFCFFLMRFAIAEGETICLQVYQLIQGFQMFHSSNHSVFRRTSGQGKWWLSFALLPAPRLESPFLGSKMINRCNPQIQSKSVQADPHQRWLYHLWDPSMLATTRVSREVITDLPLILPPSSSSVSFEH